MSVTQRLAQGRDGVGQIGLLDHGIGPERGHQRLFFDEAAGPFDQVDEKVESLRRQRDRLPLARQEPLAGVEAERTELTDERPFRFLSGTCAR